MSSPIGSHMGRPTKALIDLSAFRANLANVQASVSPSKALAVVKADAYGHGMIPLAEVASDLACDVAVVSADQAQILVEQGIDTRIWILEGPFEAQCLRLASSKFVWVIHAEYQLDLLAHHSSDHRHTVWLKLDTGMHRLGFDQDEFREVYERACDMPGIKVEGVLSHFACADLDAHPSVLAQSQAFDRQTENLSGIERSLSNSWGVMHYPDFDHDWVRPGIYLYGVENTSRSRLPAPTPVMTLASKVIALRTVESGETVGYGATWIAQRRSIIATVAIGYGDGYPRHAPNGTPVIVSGQRASLAGRVSMDMITVDVTDLDDVQIGASVELWGKHLPVSEIAEACSTISYELLTCVTQRVPRHFIG